MFYYSKQFGGFLTEDMKNTYGDRWPSDAVKITNEYHEELMDGQAKGMSITSNAEGYPIVVAQADNDWSDLVDGKWVENPERKAIIIRGRNEVKRDQLLKQARDALVVISTDIMMGEQDGEDDTEQKKVRTQLKEIVNFLTKLDLTEEFVEWPEVPQF